MQRPETDRPTDMGDVEVLLFDVGGTVFDWDTAIVEALDTTEMAPSHGVDRAAFSSAWRERSIVEMYEIADLKAPWRPFGGFIETSLDVVLSAFGIPTISASDRVILLDSWRNMPIWPGAREALTDLRNRFFIAPHTIIGLAEISFSSKRAGVGWDAIISCDSLGVTKTNPDSYAAGLRVLGVPARHVCYVAAHPVDLRAAREHGMRTAYVVARLHDYGDDYVDTGFADEFDIVAADFTDLAHQLTHLG